MKKGFLYLLLASCLLCSCDNKKLDNYDITPIKEQDLVVNDVYEAVNKLHTLKNYTLNIKIESDTENTEYYNIYAEKYFFNGYEGLEEGYIQDHNGVFRINYYNNEIIASELYLDENKQVIKDLWSSNLVPSCQQMNLANFEKARNQTTFEIPNKKDRLIAMDLFDLINTNYNSMKECSFSLLGTRMDTLYLTIKFDNATFVGHFNDFGNSKSPEVLNYKLKNYSYSTIHKDLLKAKELFALNNYKRVCYKNENPNDTIIGYEWFNENYWYGDFIYENLDSGSLYAEQGFLGLNEKTKDGVYYDGAYLFFLDEEYNIQSTMFTKPAFTTNISSLVDIMNYPSKMVMWDYNLQFFEFVENQTEYPDKNLFVTNDVYIIQDWINNFQISLDTGSSTATIYDLRIITDIVDNLDEESTVIFQFDYMLDGKIYGLQREFIDFGKANIKSVDDLYNTFSDK